MHPLKYFFSCEEISGNDAPKAIRFARKKDICLTQLYVYILYMLLSVMLSPKLVPDCGSVNEKEPLNDNTFLCTTKVQKILLIPNYFNL